MDANIIILLIVFCLFPLILVKKMQRLAKNRQKDDYVREAEAKKELVSQLQADKKTEETNRQASKDFFYHEKAQKSSRDVFQEGKATIKKVHGDINPQPVQEMPEQERADLDINLHNADSIKKAIVINEILNKKYE